jgi:hypothetical protein
MQTIKKKPSYNQRHFWAATFYGACPFRPSFRLRSFFSITLVRIPPLKPSVILSSYLDVEMFKDQQIILDPTAEDLARWCIMQDAHGEGALRIVKL